MIGKRDKKTFTRNLTIGIGAFAIVSLAVVLPIVFISKAAKIKKFDLRNKDDFFRLQQAMANGEINNTENIIIIDENGISHIGTIGSKFVQGLLTHAQKTILEQEKDFSTFINTFKDFISNADEQNITFQTSNMSINDFNNQLKTKNNKEKLDFLYNLLGNNKPTNNIFYNDKFEFVISKQHFNTVDNSVDIWFSAKRKNSNELILVNSNLSFTNFIDQNVADLVKKAQELKSILNKPNINYINTNETAKSFLDAMNSLKVSDYFNFIKNNTSIKQELENLGTVPFIKIDLTKAQIQNDFISLPVEIIINNSVFSKVDLIIHGFMNLTKLQNQVKQSFENWSDKISVNLNYEHWSINSFKAKWEGNKLEWPFVDFKFTKQPTNNLWFGFPNNFANTLKTTFKSITQNVNDPTKADIILTISNINPGSTTAPVDTQVIVVSNFISSKQEEYAHVIEDIFKNFTQQSTNIGTDVNQLQNATSKAKQLLLNKTFAEFYENDLSISSHIQNTYYNLVFSASNIVKFVNDIAVSNVEVIDLFERLRKWEKEFLGLNSLANNTGFLGINSTTKQQSIQWTNDNSFAPKSNVNNYLYNGKNYDLTTLNFNITKTSANLRNPTMAIFIFSVSLGNGQDKATTSQFLIVKNLLS